MKISYVDATGLPSTPEDGAVAMIVEIPKYNIRVDGVEIDHHATQFSVTARNGNDPFHPTPQMLVAIEMAGYARGQEQAREELREALGL